jgi:hypothetical protein
MGQQTLKDQVETRERIDLEPLAVRHETEEGRHRPAAQVAPHEESILLTSGLSTVRLLGIAVSGEGP